MDNLHLVTGYAGKDHVTSADQGAFNAALVGEGQFVLNKGSCFSAQLVNNNTVRVNDGELMMQGRYIRMDSGFNELEIDSGTQGTLRNDLVVVRYFKNATTGIEDCGLFVIKGTAVASNPADPAYTEGDIQNGATQADMPLYRVRLEGINIAEVVPLFTVSDISSSSLWNAKQDKTDTLTEESALADGDYLPFFDVSAKSNRKVLWSRIKTVLGNVFAAKEHSHTLSALGAAATSHNHSASDINSGILSVVRGGTGVASLEALGAALGCSKITSGSYVGTGTIGQNNPNKLSFAFVPKFVVVMNSQEVNPTVNNGFVYIQGMPGFGASGSLVFSLNDKTLSWYCVGNYATGQYNEDGTTYHYVACG